VSCRGGRGRGSGWRGAVCEDHGGGAGRGVLGAERARENRVGRRRRGRAGGAGGRGGQGGLAHVGEVARARGLGGAEPQLPAAWVPAPVAPPSAFRDKNTRRVGKSQSDRQVAGRNGRRTSRAIPEVQARPVPAARRGGAAGRQAGGRHPTATTRHACIISAAAAGRMQQQHANAGCYCLPHHIVCALGRRVADRAIGVGVRPSERPRHCRLLRLRRLSCRRRRRHRRRGWRWRCRAVRPPLPLPLLLVVVVAAHQRAGHRAEGNGRGPRGWLAPVPGGPGRVGQVGDGG
jgi:hypothetical protein